MLSKLANNIHMQTNWYKKIAQKQTDSFQQCNVAFAQRITEQILECGNKARRARSLSADDPFFLVNVNYAEKTDGRF